MIWEANIVYVEKNGKDDESKKGDNVKKEQYLLENYETFSEVEKKLLAEFGETTEIMVIKKSRLKEITNESDEKNNKIFIASMEDVRTDDNGKEKVLKYTIALFSSDISHATKFMENYIQEGYDMHFTGIKETKFVDLIEYTDEDKKLVTDLKDTRDDGANGRDPENLTPDSAN